jgi:phosphoribosylaminoimidazole-succinocarboxamide synthase
MRSRSFRGGGAHVAAGSLSQRLGIEEGTVPPRSIIESITRTTSSAIRWCRRSHHGVRGLLQEIDDIMALAIRVNDFLSGLFLGVGIRLVDFKMETGFLGERSHADRGGGRDLARPAGWDIKSNEKLDKDRFRRDLGGLLEVIPRCQAPRHHERGRAAAGHRARAGEELRIADARWR